MMRSLFSAVSGLKAHQTKMDVIGNNIANVNTVAYKSQSVTFSDVYYQTTQTASGPSSDGTKGGTNAKQIGLGSTVAAISTAIDTQGATERTDNAWDLCISGDAFFVINNAGSTYFTRSGDFKLDTDGALVTSGGCNVMGWVADSEGNITADKVQALYPMSDEWTYTSPEATTGVSLTGNINAASSDTTVTTVSFYDSLGNSYLATLNINYAGQQTGTAGTADAAVYTITAGEVTKNGEKTDLTFTVSGGYSYNGATAGSGSGTNTNTLAFNANSGASITDNANLILTFSSPGGANTNDLANIGTGTYTVNGTSTNGVAGQIKLDGSSLTRYTDSQGSSIKDSLGITDASTGDVTGKGKAVGSMTSLGVDDKGCIVASYSNGDTRTIGQIAVATFTNAAGLEKVGENMYAATLNSGSFNGIGVSIDSTGGKVSSGYLEMSNVDLSDQFTSMITTQRGFQANSRIITVSDSMLEELINLKR